MKEVKTIELCEETLVDIYKLTSYYLNFSKFSGELAAMQIRTFLPSDNRYTPNQQTYFLRLGWNADELKQFRSELRSIGKVDRYKIQGIMWFHDGTCYSLGNDIAYLIDKIRIRHRWGNSHKHKYPSEILHRPRI